MARMPSVTIGDSSMLVSYVTESVTFNIFSSRTLLSARPSLINCWTRMLDASVFPAPLSPKQAVEEHTLLFKTK